ncbi:hypothetical protein PG994_004458 [Apiospora phragmitis]|uniref:Uncharacterized protein n=1 Tax=Apiospora phragmitis TaxID=2905665 RepID=A0ABR1VQN3_9PEZI
MQHEASACPSSDFSFPESQVATKKCSSPTGDDLIRLSFSFMRSYADLPIKLAILDPRDASNSETGWLQQAIPASWHLCDGDGEGGYDDYSHDADNAAVPNTTTTVIQFEGRERLQDLVLILGIHMKMLRVWPAMTFASTDKVKWLSFGSDPTISLSSHRCAPQRR